MKAKIVVVSLVLGAAIAGMFMYRSMSFEQGANHAVSFGAQAYRLDDRTYARLATLAQGGDCEAAYKVARHHVFFTSNRDEAKKWYRIAAKCPHANAKDELANLLMYTPEDDAEVERLLSELERLDPKKARSSREGFATMRSIRDRPSN